MSQPSQAGDADPIGRLDELTKQDDVAIRVGQYVTYRGGLAEVTGIHADGTFDVQLIDELDQALRNKEEQPLWYERIAATEISAS